MTPPRRIVAGKTWSITRRCSERRFFLRPSDATNQLILYVLALAAQRYKVLIHAFCVMSNHLHLVATDAEARLPAFMQYFCSLVARGVNASIGHFENLWAKDGSYSAVEPLEPSDIVAKMAYALANPVAAGLVRRGAEWPGLWTAPEKIGTTKLTVHRPEGFFDPEGQLPESVELELTVPPCFSSPDEFRAQLADALRELEEEHRRKLAAKGRGFLGAARVLAQDPFSAPQSQARRFGLKPRIAGRNESKRVEALSLLAAFERQYRSARASWCSGMRDVIFPAGTYLMRIMFGVQCAGAA